MADLLSIEPHGEVAVVTLERPEKRNALSIELRVELGDAFERLSGDPEVGCVVLTGAGPAFCSGMDVTQFGGDADNRRRLLDSSTRAFDGVASCARPVIAAVNGPAIAGGFVLALLCDVRLAGREAVFGFTELGRGIPPSYAAARSALPAALAAELCLTGRAVGAAEAVRLGIVSEPAADDVVERAVELGHEIAARPRDAVLQTKRRVRMDREQTWGFLFDDERLALQQALLGDEPDPAA